MSYKDSMSHNNRHTHQQEKKFHMSLLNYDHC